MFRVESSLNPPSAPEAIDAVVVHVQTPYFLHSDRWSSEDFEAKLCGRQLPRIPKLIKSAASSFSTLQHACTVV